VLIYLIITFAFFIDAKGSVFIFVTVTFPLPIGLGSLAFHSKVIASWSA
tara:strand:- start:680 stop:826 length:147 start_codon:yes stop_codon:yes gene_type:complete